MRRYSEACEQNKEPILNVLKNVFKDSQTVLEIGSGSGQHAVYFAAHLPHLIWQPSDLYEYLASIRAWMDHVQSLNIKAPIELNVCNHPWPIESTSAIFTANTFHIMSWQTIEQFFIGVGKVLPAEGLLVVYGPFSYQGIHTSQSNVKFDRYLKQQDAQSGVRDFVDLNRLAAQQGLELIEDFEMPTNNRSLVWQRY